MIEAKTKDFKVGDKEIFVTVNQLDGMKGALLGFNLLKRMAPAFTVTKPEERAAKVLSALADMSEADFSKLMADLLKDRLVIRIPSEDRVEPDGFNHLGEICKGEPMIVFQIVYFALQANFGSFFSKAVRPAQK